MKKITAKFSLFS